MRVSTVERSAGVRFPIHYCCSAWFQMVSANFHEPSFCRLSTRSICAAMVFSLFWALFCCLLTKMR